MQDDGTASELDENATEPEKPRKSVEELEAEFKNKYDKGKAARADKRKHEVLKRPSVAKKPSAATSKPVRIWSGKKPSCPNIDEGPTDYKSGRIYISQTKCGWRVIRTRGQYNTEKNVCWSDRKKPDNKSWNVALKAVDDWKP